MCFGRTVLPCIPSLHHQTHLVPTPVPSPALPGQRSCVLTSSCCSTDGLGLASRGAKAPVRGVLGGESVITPGSPEITGTCKAVPGRWEANATYKVSKYDERAESPTALGSTALSRQGFGQPGRERGRQGGQGASGCPGGAWGKGKRQRGLWIWKKGPDTGDGYWRWKCKSSGGKKNCWSNALPEQTRPMGALLLSRPMVSLDDQAVAEIPSLQGHQPQVFADSCHCSGHMSLLHWETEPRRCHKVTGALTLPSITSSTLLLSSAPKTQLSPGTRTPSTWSLLEEQSQPSHLGWRKAQHPSQLPQLSAACGSIMKREHGPLPTGPGALASFQSGIFLLNFFF